MNEQKMMPFSEAARLGAAIGPQLFGHELTSEDPTASCAFGGAILAAGLKIGPSIEASRGLRPNTIPSGSVEIPLEWRTFFNSWQVCPQCPTYHAEQGIKMVAHLNDDHGLSREAIADWIESREAALALSQTLGPLDVAALEAK